jgi:hypothetical protein
MPKAAAERRDPREFFIRLVSVLGMVGVAFAILLAVNPA